MEDENGGTVCLTNQSSASRYGIPVLQIIADDIDGEFGRGYNLGSWESSTPDIWSPDGLFMGKRSFQDSTGAGGGHGLFGALA
ncbi:MAG: hypothetical protein V1714_04640 [Pseudomonadota bacterium]